MTTATRTITAEQLFSMPEDGKRYELVEGELRVMTPTGDMHGATAANITALLWNHVRQQGLGQVFAAETGFLLSRNPDTVRAPDVAFVAKQSLPENDAESRYLALSPELIVEVVSPNDRFTQVEEKTRVWLRAGTVMVLVVDPKTRRVHVYRTKDTITVLSESDVLDASDAVPAWTPPVAEFFG